MYRSGLSGPQLANLLNMASHTYEDESLDLKDLERSTLAEALFFEYLAAPCPRRASTCSAEWLG